MTDDRCRLCSSETDTEDHHLVYADDDMFGVECELVMTVCLSCHQDIHNGDGSLGMFDPKEGSDEWREFVQTAMVSEPMSGVYRLYSPEDEGLRAYLPPGGAA